MWKANLLQLNLLIILSCGVFITLQQDDDLQVFQQEPVPDPFTLGDRYPDRDEVVEVRPIKLRLRRTSRRFSETIIRNTNNDLSYANDDARFMTSRLKSRLDTLGELYEDRYRRQLQVLLTYAEENNPSITDPTSLHYEGRTARIRGRSRSELRVILSLAVQAGFDWVSYENEDYCRVSVIPDVCQTNLDLLFLLDQSGSVGRRNHDLALEFMEAVVNFFEVGSDLTRVGVFTFSSGAREDFDLDRYLNNRQVTRAIDRIGYRGGYTHTALALDLATNAFNNPSRSGARQVSAGIPRVVVLITDGRSNVFDITLPALNLLASGVTVYSVGVGNVDVDELRFIASDPDREHVFLLRSFTDAASFVQLLSGTTCDTPARVPPGKPTDGECDEDDFRYFEVTCPAFTETVIIEQLDIIGICALYVSVDIVNPSPVDPTEVTFRNETVTVSRRTLFVTINAKKIVYISIRGIAKILNRFQMTVYSMLFDQEVYTASVPSGQVVDNVIDLDILNDTDNLYTFSITAGNEDGRFAIGENTGVISTTTTLDAQEQDFYNLTVEAYLTSNDCKQGRAYVEITVIATNNNPPVFQPTNPVSILETAAVGSSVVTVTATDADFGINGEVRYSITGGNTGNAFVIDPVTGAISVAAALNHTILPSYTLTLTATDQAVNNPRTATTTQVVNILDVNQPPFFITLCAIENRCAFMVSEGAPVDTTLQTISAGDPDPTSSPNGQLTFKLDPDDTQFLINNMGQISLNSSLDREAQDQYIFILFINDGGDPSLGTFTRITFTVIDINDNAPILVAPNSVNVSEGTPVNVTVAQLSAFDADIRENAAVSFNLTGSSFFSVDSVTGVITLAASLDFETATEHNVTVNAVNPDGLSSEPQIITFNVINENDNAPIFAMDPYTASVVEHSDAGTPVTTVQADDADAGILGVVEYSIVGGNVGNAFSINSTTGLISVNGDIDRESVTSFTLQVRAQDFGNPPRSDRARVEITITDINDNAPIFSPSVYFKTIRENAAVGTVIGTVTATDADEPGNPNSMILYNLTGGNVMDAFTISPSNGSISIASALDFEVVSNYILTVTGTDQGDPAMSGTATVNISVIDVNDMPPNISGNQTVMLSERTVTPFAVARFTASQEIGDNNMFTLNDTNGAHNGEFDIDENNGIVTLVMSLDFETTQFYSFEVVVSDGQFSVSSFLRIIVLDENDNTPQFDVVGPFSVTEEMPEGILVGQVTATDGDSGENGEIQFTIVSNIGGDLFTINASTGMIHTTAVLDREALANMNLFAPPASQQVLVVQAEDRGIPSLFSQADVTIQLLDINDNSPQFISIPSSISLLENIAIDTFIIDASATDADLGVNGEVSYSLSSGVPFSINSSTGAVTTSATLDREDIDMYVFSIIASDNGTPRRSNTTMVMVTVLDVNDNAPEFQENLPLIVAFPEGDSFDGGSVEVGRLSATDRDIGRNAEIDYSLSPDADPRFSVRDDGDMVARIQVRGSINFEGQGLFNVTVIATDRGEPPMSSLALVIVVIQDTDEFLPMFRDSCDASIPESFPVGSNNTITQCIADDQDGDNVFYEIFIESQNPSLSTFRLNTVSGAIFLQESLDRETLDSYQFTLMATSNGDTFGGMVASMSVRINVTDVNDNAPVFSPSQIAVTYSDPQAQNIATLTVTDDDINENGEVTVDITSVVRTNRPNGMDTHEIIITSEDMGMPSMSGSATVVVTNGFPCQIMEFSLDSDTLQLSVATLCSLSNPPVSQDYLLGTEVILDCSAVTNLPVTYQWQLDGSFITTPSSDPTLNLGQIDFDDAGSYSCIARTDVGSIQSQNAVIGIISQPVIIRGPDDVVVEIDRLVTLPCVSDGVPMPNVTFFMDGNAVELDTRVIQNGQFLVITRVVASDDGAYTCTAQNSAGTSTSGEGRLVVFRPENMVSTVIQLNNPNDDGTCHNLDSNLIEQLLESTTERSVEVTSVTAASGFCNSGPCYPNPCINDGICSLNENASNGFECACPDAFTGDLCEVDVNECPILEPCLFGGNCTNIRGSFSCTCPPDRRGHRCQYEILCDNASRCADGETCVETLANVNGFVCDSTLPGETLTIQLSEGVTEDVLSETVFNVNDQLNNINNNITTTKRQTSNSPDFCEPRFIKTTAESVFQLVWACPNGTDSPSGSDVLQFICTRFIEASIIESCAYPDGSTQAPPTPAPLQPIDVNVTLIILDDGNGEPLSGNQAIALLIESQSLGALMSAGLTANDFVTSDTSTSNEGSDSDGGISGGAIAGIIIGVIIAIVIVTIIVVIVVVFAMRAKENDSIESGQKATQSQTVQALQAPMLHKQQQRVSTAGGIIENPAFRYQSPQDPPNITKLDGNTEVARKDAISRINNDNVSTSTDNLLNS